MRGKGLQSQEFRRKVRITPAYAGKSSSMPVSAPVLAGSPPRMRGKGLPYGEDRVPARITPAYAGKRLCLYITIHAHEDHPRVCGEKTKKIP